MIWEILFWVAVAGAVYFLYTKAKAMIDRSSSKPEKGKGGGGGGSVNEPEDLKPPKK